MSIAHRSEIRKTLLVDIGNYAFSLMILSGNSWLKTFGIKKTVRIIKI
jgi:hypothetical protein